MSGSIKIHWGQSYLRRFSVHKFDLYLANVKREMEKFFPSGISNILGVGKGQEVRWNFDDDQLRQFGERVLEKTRRDAATGRNHARDMQRSAAQAIRRIQAFDRVDFSAVSSVQLSRYFRAFLSVVGRSLPIIYAPLVIEGPLFTHARTLLESKYPNRQLARRWDSVITPLHPIPIKRQQLALWSLLARGQRVSPTALKGYWQRFRWLGMRFVDDQPLALADCARQVAAERRHPWRKQAREYKNELRRRRVEFHQTVRPYPRTQRRFFRLVNEYSALRHERDVYRGTAYYFGHFLYREILRRYRLDTQALFTYSVSEVEALLATGKNLGRLEVQRRQQRFVYLMVDGRRRIFSRPRQMDAIIRMQLPAQPAIRSGGRRVTGQTAHPGVVRGRVRIIHLTHLLEDLRQFRSGEIMVAESTKPEYVPAMKKSRAVITNEGGITSHAAIIAREFQIPCVIGTKIATQVLKDGDWVEVDATKGVVRKIKP